MTAALKSEGFSVRSGPRLAEGTKSMWGAYGSPVFHWALASLIVVFILGAAFRAEGVVNLPVGGRWSTTLPPMARTRAGGPQ